MGNRNSCTLHLCHGPPSRRDQQETSARKQNPHPADRCALLDSLSHHVMAASSDQDDHVLTAIHLQGKVIKNPHLTSQRNARSGWGARRTFPIGTFPPEFTGCTG